MPNGVAAKLPCANEPLTPIKAAPGKPSETEQRIGEMVANAALADCGGVNDADGALSSATRTRAGDLFVQLYRLQEATGTAAFATLAP
jgi:hypothetical protein